VEVPLRGDRYAVKLAAPKQIPSSNAATPKPINIPSSKNLCDRRRDSGDNSRWSLRYFNNQIMLAMKHPAQVVATALTNPLPAPGLASINPKAQMPPNTAITTKEVKKPTKKLSPSVNRVGVRSLECQYSKC
jgi:hypothetical protein